MEFELNPEIILTTAGSGNKSPGGIPALERLDSLEPQAYFSDRLVCTLQSNFPQLFGKGTGFDPEDSNFVPKSGKPPINNHYLYSESVYRVLGEGAPKQHVLDENGVVISGRNCPKNVFAEKPMRRTLPHKHSKLDRRHLYTEGLLDDLSCLPFLRKVSKEYRGFRKVRYQEQMQSLRALYAK